MVSTPTQQESARTYRADPEHILLLQAVLESIKSFQEEEQKRQEEEQQRIWPGPDLSETPPPLIKLTTSNK